jgi:tripartite-type tricarboxylate transporter receptor subunit TctC
MVGRILVSLLTAFFAMTPMRYALAQVQIVIPFPAGGGADIIGRLIQPVFADALGQQVVIRNVGGAVGTIGTAEVVRSRPDG